MRRLEKLGLVRSLAKKTGKRERREYAVTAAGKKALKAWVGPPMSREAVTVAHDPLRTRARFLEVLSRREQLVWVAAARSVLDEVEERVREWAEQEGGGKRAAAMMTLSGELDVKSRRAWVGAVGKMVG